MTSHYAVVVLVRPMRHTARTRIVGIIENEDYNISAGKMQKEGEKNHTKVMMIVSHPAADRTVHI